MSINLKRSTILKDALYNVRSDSGATDEYSKGLVVGVVSTLLAATDMSFDEAMAVVKASLPARYIPGRIPEAFRAHV